MHYIQYYKIIQTEKHKYTTSTGEYVNLEKFTNFHDILC